MPQKTTPKPLERKIGAEEANDGFLFIEKAWLAKLPDVGKPFYLKLGKSDLKVTIESSGACDCRGPDKPHEHYRLRLPLISLSEGTIATLRPINTERVTLEIAE